VSGVSGLITLFDASLLVSCAFHVTGLIGYSFFKRDHVWTLERCILVTPVIVSLIVFVLQDAHVSGVTSPIPLLSMEVVSILSTWLYLREISSSVDNGTFHVDTDTPNTSDFYLAAGSLPLHVCLFWWFGENRMLSKSNRGGLWLALMELSGWHKCLMFVICLLDFMRTSISRKLLNASSPKYLVAADLAAWLLLLTLASAFSSFNDVTSIWGVVLMAATCVFVILFVGSEGVSSKRSRKT
jgi:hypothetical protein